MATVFQRAYPTGPFRWKLFLLVLAIMGSITAAAIMLTLKANPRRGTVHVPPPQPVSRLIFPVQTNQNDEPTL